MTSLRPIDVLILILASTFTIRAQISGEKIWEVHLKQITVSSPAIDLDGTVYIADSQEKTVYAFDGSTGSKKWEFQAGDIVHATPAIGSDGTVYVGCWDAKLYALDGKTGALKWSFLTEGSITSSPVIGRVDGTVYVGCAGVPRIYALDASQGHLKWKIETEYVHYTALAQGRDDTLIYANSFPNILAIETATGQMRWKFKTLNPFYDLFALGMGENGIVYASSSDGMFYALNDQTGTKIWEFKAQDHFKSGPAIGTDGTVYVGNNDRKIYALDGKTGMVKWSFPTPGPIYTVPVIGADNVLYVAADALYAIDANTGAKLWQFSGGNSARSSPALSADGLLYVVMATDTARLYALRTSSKGLAGSPWPKAGGNNQNNGRATFRPHKATAAPAIVNGSIVGVTVLDAGYGYTNAPAVTISSASGSGAVFNVVMGTGFIKEILIENPGSGYSPDAKLDIAWPPVPSSLNIVVSKVRLNLSLRPGQVYQIESSKDLKAWGALGLPFRAESESMTQEVDVLEHGQYFRLREH
ncbi:MAG: PQQ-binding-like beta-propeller repeat protein [Verrucomicrobiota bacterium]